MDYLKEAEKMVNVCELLEEEYLMTFIRKKRKEKDGVSFDEEMKKCDKLSKELEKIDPNRKLQAGFSLPGQSEKFENMSEKERGEYLEKNHRRLITTAIRLLKQGKLKPLK